MFFVSVVFSYKMGMLKTDFSVGQTVRQGMTPVKLKGISSIKRTVFE